MFPCHKADKYILLTSETSSESLIILFLNETTENGRYKIISVYQQLNNKSPISKLRHQIGITEIVYAHINIHIVKF